MLTVFSENSQIISIVTDYECVTCHRVFQSEDVSIILFYLCFAHIFVFLINNCFVVQFQMLKEHLNMCREEDDSTNILELNNIASYDSEEENENENEDEEDNYIIPDLTLEGVYNGQRNIWLILL